MNIPDEILFKHSLANGINLFLGAGFSVEAKGDNRYLPAGDDLRLELLKHFNRDSKSRLTLPQLCQILSAKEQAALAEYFGKRFVVSGFDELYLNLERVNIKAIFTTNIDDLIFKIFQKSSKYYINDIVLRGPSLSGANAIEYIALHGCVSHGSGAYDFSPVELASSFERDKDKWFGYIGRIQKTPTLYWGYRLEDAGVLQALSKESTNGRARADSWIVLRKSEPETIEYYESLGFKIIIADTIELLKYLGQLPVKKIPGASKSVVAKNFPEFKLPSLEISAARSISEFYLGAEPSWFDIHSGKIHQTRHVSKAKNVILGNRNLILIGAAVTGKTTLLKQLAVWYSEVGSVLYAEEISLEKAKLLSRDIAAENKNILIFVDNIADASEAIQELAKNKNIKIVGAERDYIFDSVSHKFPKNYFEILDVSGLTDLDVQSVQNLIPQDVRRTAYTPSTELDSEALPTFFEVITSTIVADSLLDRFMDALKNFKSTRPQEHDLLLVACYMYFCRVPISVDVGTAFSRSHSISVEDVLEKLQSMHSLLSPYEGALADSDQSFFVPRSRYVSEAVMKRIATSDLRRMLDVFHEEVSPTKIGRYDIFRRLAYDAKLIGRAFPNWRDGLVFYEKASLRDTSHSLKQQGAIYLSDKRNYNLAFTWIDDALAKTGRHNPPVRNTFAVILFNANYEKPDSSAVQMALEESMDILAKCYRDDQRKIYHTRIYAEQALKYRDRFPASEHVPVYLETSENWLISELRDRPTDRWMNQLLKKIRNARRMR